jgi:hypothetical protein
MAAHACEGTYLIAWGEVSIGIGHSDVSGEDAKSQAEDDASPTLRVISRVPRK